MSAAPEGTRFVGLVVGSFASAFLGGLLLLRISLALCRLLCRLLGGASPVASAPSGGGQGMSAEKRKEIDDLRSTAIRRYLQNFTLTLDEGDATAGDKVSILKEPKTERHLGSEEGSVAETEEREEVDEELGDEKHEEKTGEECISIPLLARNDCECRDDSDSSVVSIQSSTQPIHDQLKCIRGNNRRCAICHERYKPSDRICWSSNAECKHAYHEECTVRWLVSLGWMKKVPVTGDGKQGKELLNYELECPTCRSPFIDKSLFDDAAKRAAEEKA